MLQESFASPNFDRQPDDGASSPTIFAGPDCSSIAGSGGASATTGSSSAVAPPSASGTETSGVTSSISSPSSSSPFFVSSFCLLSSFALASSSASQAAIAALSASAFATADVEEGVAPLERPNPEFLGPPNPPKSPPRASKTSDLFCLFPLGSFPPGPPRRLINASNMAAI